MKAGRRRSATAAVLLGVVGLLMLTSSSGAQVAPVYKPVTPPVYEPASCGYTSVVRDFLKPLRKMAPIQEPPASGKLPFAPKGMNLETKGSGLIVGGGLVGFGFRDEAVQQVRHLNWIVETRLMKVDGSGDVTSRLGVRRRKVGSIEGDSIGGFRLRVSGVPAFYRVDISFFRSGTHDLLGEYSTYARVVRPKADLRVVVETPSVLPGDLVTAKLVNMGTLPVRSEPYDYGFDVEALSGENWSSVPENPRRGRVPRGRLTPRPTQFLGAGMQVRGCLRYLVPTNQVPGIFRFIAYGVPRQASAVLAAGFEVRAGPLEHPIGGVDYQVR